MRLLIVALVLQLALGGGFVWLATHRDTLPWFDDGVARTPVPVPRVDRFDARRALALVREQLALGPRPSGSPASQRLAARLAALLPGGRIESAPGGVRNVVGELPGRPPAVALAAHYDTKDLPRFIGANDGAAGSAVIVELARSLATLRRPPSAPALRFVLFDGEESPRGTPERDFARAGLRGSRADAHAHARELRALVLVDFVGQPKLRLARERGSDPGLWSQLREAADRIGTQALFPAATRAPILDDHTPFRAAGVPSVDLIDFDYHCFHRPCDDLRQVSERSLDAVGETLVELVRHDRLTG